MTFFFTYLINGRRKLKDPTKTIGKRRKTLEQVGQCRTVEPSLNKDEGKEEAALVGEHKQQKTLKEQETTDPCLILKLPTCILADILSRLSFRIVCLCRCVCRAWRSVTCSHDFNSLRLERADTEIFIRSSSAIYVSRTLHLVDFQRISASVPPHDWLERREIDMEMRVCLPKLDRRDDGLDFCGKKSFVAKVEYAIVNSCNGFLCLRKSSSIQWCKNPCIVCNPFTGEFIAIPKPDKKESLRNWGIVSGFGCSSKSNEYKVVRLVYRNSALNLFDRKAEVHTLGTGSWRTVGNAPRDTIFESSNTFLNGTIHWLSAGNDLVKYSILTFDFVEEQFHVFSLPSHFCEKLDDDLSKSQLSIGVLQGCLIVSGITYLNQLEIWVMKDYGKEGSWTQEFSLNVFMVAICRPIKWLENGVLVMLWDRMSLLLYNPVNKRARLFKIRDAKSVMFEAIVLVPSFTSLKDIVAGNNLVVQNANLRWTESELREEAEVVSLMEESKQGMEWALNIW